MVTLTRASVILGILAWGVAHGAAAQPLGTLPHGEYVCALPGDASGNAWQVVPEMGFSISNASTYTTQAGTGIYLMAGDEVAFTRGPMKGMRFRFTGNATLILLDAAGKPGRIRCTRGGGSAAP